MSLNRIDTGEAATHLLSQSLESLGDFVPVGDNAANRRGEPQTKPHDFQYKTGNFHFPVASFFDRVTLLYTAFSENTIVSGHFSLVILVKIEYNSYK